jgi:two-component system sensor histidine kinase PilS (NtrC family)
VTSPLALRLRWLIGLRVLIITTVLVPLLLLQFAHPLSLDSFVFLYEVAGWTYALSLVYIALLRVLRAHPRLQARIQLLGDAGIVTLLVYHLGGATNHFSIFYLSVIAVAAVLLDRRDATFIAGFCWLLYLATVVSLEAGWLPHPASGLYVPLSNWRLGYDLAIQLGGFLAAAWLMSHRALNVSRVEEELERQQVLMADLEILQRDVFDSVPSGLILTDRDGRIAAVNPAGYSILGVDASVLLGQSPVEAGLFSSLAWDQEIRGIPEPQPQRSQVIWEVDGRQRTIGYSLTPLVNSSGVQVGFILIFQDLTDLQRMQEQLQVQDRMAAVGELAAGVAHEIGNPLTAISGSVQMLSSRAAFQASDRQLLEIIRKETDRLSRSIQSLLSFARPPQRADTTFCIEELLQECMELLRNSSELSAGHDLEFEIAETHTSLTADRDQINQVFWNLARNALRAMPEGGTLHVEGMQDGERYLLTFRDNGCGMTSEEKANVFHPFRSFFDGGTGMGMAIVYRIVEEHGGSIDVESAPEHGTAITVALPLAPVQAEISGIRP